MSNEAFALSPISARAASPTDADFEAIREAFLETARGRWFLDEYTKRNRNADTAMVLEAVARIENSLAAQKEEQRQAAAEQALHEAAQSEPPLSELPSNELPEAMAAVKAIVAAARESAAQALAGPVLEEALAPARKCARVIREIAWGLRESGADGRICFLLESQVDAINAACDHAATAGPHDEVLRAFDQAAQDIEALSPSAAQPQAEAEPVATIDAADLSAVPVIGPGPSSEDTSGELDLQDDELFDAAPEIADSISLTAAIETATPIADYRPVEVASMTVEPIELAQPEIAKLEAIPEISPEPIAGVESDSTTIETAVAGTLAVEAIAVEAIAVTPASTSLGASLIASGIVARPVSPRSDPLAPIRRMSQAEKVAFFS